MAKLINAEFKRRWIEALRSGKYKQGKNMLRQDIPQPDGTVASQYCCLGVACEVAIEMGIINAVWRHEPSDASPHMMMLECFGSSYTHMPPRAVAVKLFDVSSPQTLTYVWHVGSDQDDSRRLPHMNDERNLTFAQIADAIERGM